MYKFKELSEFSVRDVERYKEFCVTFDDGSDNSFTYRGSSSGEPISINEVLSSMNISCSKLVKLIKATTINYFYCTAEKIQHNDTTAPTVPTIIINEDDATASASAPTAPIAETTTPTIVVNEDDATTSMAALSELEKDTIIAVRHGVDLLTVQQLHAIATDDWISDTAIDIAMDFIVEELPKERAKTFKVIQSKCLTSYFAYLADETKARSLMLAKKYFNTITEDVKQLFFVIHHNSNHWFLAVINLECSEDKILNIYIFDSLKAIKNKPEEIKSYERKFQKFMREFCGMEIEAKIFNMESMNQLDCHNCGIFTIENFRSIVNGNLKMDIEGDYRRIFNRNTINSSRYLLMEKLKPFVVSQEYFPEMLEPSKVKDFLRVDEN